MSDIKVSLELDGKQYSAQLKQVEKDTAASTTKLNEGFSGVGASVLGLTGKIGALGAALAGAAIGKYTIDVIGYAGAIADLSDATGISIQTIYSLQRGLIESGKSASDADTLISRFSANLGAAADGSNRDFLNSMSDLGVSVFDAAGNVKSTEAVFKESVKVIAGLGDGADAARLKVLLFVRSAATTDFGKLNANLSGTKSGFDELANKGIQRADDIGDAYEKAASRLKRAFLAAFGAIGEENAKILGSQAFGATIGAGVGGVIGGVGGAFFGGVGAVPGAAGGAALGGAIGAGIGGLTADTSTGTKAVTAATSEATKAAEANAAATAKQEAAYKLTGSQAQSYRDQITQINTGYNSAVGNAQKYIKENKALSGEFKAQGDELLRLARAVDGAKAQEFLRNQSMEIASKLQTATASSTGARITVEDQLNDTFKKNIALSQMIGAAGRARLITEAKAADTAINAATAGKMALQAEIAGENEISGILGVKQTNLSKLEQLIKVQPGLYQQLGDVAVANLKRIAEETDAVALTTYVTVLKRSFSDLQTSISQDSAATVASIKAETDQLGLSPIQKKIEAARAQNVASTISAQNKIRAEVEKTKATYDDGILPPEVAAEYTRQIQQLGVDSVTNFGAIQEAIQTNYDQSRTWSAGWSEAFQQYIADAGNAASRSASLFNTSTKAMEDLFINFAKTGKLSFSDFVNTIGEEIIRLQAKALAANIMKALFEGGTGAGAGSGGGGFFSTIGSAIGKFFAGGFAEGGVIGGGKFGIVGENGPEFVSGPAGITPMDKLAGGGDTFHVNFNISAIDTQSGAEFIMRNKPIITGVIEQAYNKRGRRGPVTIG